MRNRVFPIIALVLSVGIFYVYIYPLWNGDISATKATIAQDNQAIAAANQYTSQENTLTSQRNAISTTSLARLDEFLPDSVNQVGLILDLNGLMARSGLTLTGISTTQNATSSASATTDTTDAEGPAIGSVDVNVSATGTYNDFMNFLYSVENSEELLDVQDLTITSSNTGVYTYSMKIQTYWLP